MQVAVYPNPDEATPYLCVLSPCEDTAIVAADKALGARSIPYKIIDDSELPAASRIAQALTVDVSGADPVFGYDMTLAKQIATAHNSNYWQSHYDNSVVELGMNAYQISLALSTPEDERTAEQVAAVEILSGYNTLQMEIQSDIDAAQTGEELINILSQIG